MNIREATTEDLRAEIARRGEPASERYPHGECECRDGCGCAGIPGPAAFTVERHGKTVRVCTRCDLTSDSNKALLVTEDTPMDAYGNWDGLGLFCLAGMLAQKRAGEPNGKAEGT